MKGDLTLAQKKHIKKVSKQFEQELTNMMSQHIKGGGVFDDILKVSKDVGKKVIDIYSDPNMKPIVDDAVKQGLPVLVKILAGNIQRLNHLNGLQPMTPEEIDYYDANHKHHIHGSGFWDGFYKGFKSVLKPGLDILSPIVGAPVPVGSLAFGAIDKIAGKGMEGEGIEGEGMYKRGHGHRVAGSHRVAGGHRVAGDNVILGKSEVSKPPKQYRQDIQREMTPADYV